MILKLTFCCLLGAFLFSCYFFLKEFPSSTVVSGSFLLILLSPLQGFPSLQMKGYVFSTKSSAPRSVSKLMLTYKTRLKPQALPAGCLRSPSCLGKETPSSHAPARLPRCPTSFYQHKGRHCLQGATQITAPSSCVAPDPDPAPGLPTLCPPHMHAGFSCNPLPTGVESGLEGGRGCILKGSADALRG